MIRNLISATLIAAITSVGATAPAQAADNDDIARAVFGLLALGLLANSVSQHQDYRGERRKVVNNYYETPKPRVHQKPRVHHKPRTIEGEVIRREGSFRLPQSCVRRVRTSDGSRTFVGRPCLEKKGVNTVRLPNRCERILELDRRTVRAWNVRCLSDGGYRLN